MKVLINNRKDFDNWREYNNSCDFISYAEDEPKYYPCIVTSRYVDTGDFIYDDLYYEFVYLQDFELDKD